MPQNTINFMKTLEKLPNTWRIEQKNLQNSDYKHQIAQGQKCHRKQPKYKKYYNQNSFWGDRKMPKCIM